MNIGKLGFLLLIAAVPAGFASAQKYRDSKMTAIELMQLPEYCHAQYVDDKLSGNPKYSIQGCGAYMNHYCPGLVQLERAKKVSAPRPERRENIRMAKNNFNYTLVHMPQVCWLRPYATDAMERAVAVEATIR